MANEDKRNLYVFEQIARLIEQPEDHDFQLQEALEEISNSLQSLNLLNTNLERKIKDVVSTPGTPGKNAYVHFAYATDENGGGFTTTPEAGKYWVGFLSNFDPTPSTDHNDYEWTNTRGQKGDDGRSSHLYIAYADDANGGGFNVSSSGKEFIGTCVSFDATQPTDPDLYTWIQWKGPAGESGTKWVYKEDWDSSAPSTAQLNSWFVSLAGRQPKNNDVIYLRNHNTDPIDVAAYFVLNGTWTKYANVIDGDMLVDGGILGKHISSLTTIKAGSGSNAVIVNGDQSAGSQYKGFLLVAGDEDPTKAELVIKTNGDAEFNGDVKAGRVVGAVGVTTTYSEVGDVMPVWRVNYNSNDDSHIGRLMVKKETFARVAVVEAEIDIVTMSGIINGTTTWDANIEKMCDSYVVSNAPGTVMYRNRFLRIEGKSASVAGEYTVKGRDSIRFRWVGYNNNAGNKEAYAESYGRLLWIIDIPASTTDQGILTIPLDATLKTPGEYWGGYTADAGSYIVISPITTIMKAEIRKETASGDLYLARV
ncbi:hypothetical protein [Vibrio harveyi]|uniref:hypothetical protein n=1 Tax=Vibrio harveyi TaxID=669 RepID=UPI00165D5027|nr:hypothetical protein [Vibrio harveyi]